MRRRWRVPWDPYFVGPDKDPSQFVWVPEAICPRCDHVGMWLDLEPFYQEVMVRLRLGAGAPFEYDPLLRCERSYPRSNADRCWSTGWWVHEVAFSDGSHLLVDEARSA